MVIDSRTRKDSLPWYRSPKYKGNLTEDEKRELDSFRSQEKNYGRKHPAAGFDDLPNEVQLYTCKLRIELFDKVQKSLFCGCLFVSGVGVFVLLNYFEWIVHNHDSTESLLVGAVLLSAPIVYYKIKCKRNANHIISNINEGIITEWELEYIAENQLKNNKTS